MPKFFSSLPRFFLNREHNFESSDHTSNAGKTGKAAIKIINQKYVFYGIYFNRGPLW